MKYYSSSFLCLHVRLNEKQYPDVENDGGWCALQPFNDDPSSDIKESLHSATTNSLDSLFSRPV